MRHAIPLIILALFLSACGGRQGESAPLSTATAVATIAAVTNGTPDAAAEAAPAATETAGDATGTAGAGRGMTGGGMMGGGMGSGMHERHMAPIPEEYAGLMSPVAADADSLERGKKAYDLFCISCHGENGTGDGPAAAALDPTPPAWKATLDEETRWDLVSYMRNMDAATGAAAAQERTQRGEMLVAAQDQGIISAAEAELFERIHSRLDESVTDARRNFTGSMEEVQAAVLQELVDSGLVTTEDADAFNAIHDRLLEAGVME
jgi:mono/diheme cytochrome c family protein